MTCLQQNPDLSAALDYNGVALSSPPAEVLLEITGENDGPSWHWIVRLEGGAFAYITGSCDYTGWDCQSSAEAHEADTLDGALALVDEANRAVLVEMRERGEPQRAARSDW